MNFVDVVPVHRITSPPPYQPKGLLSTDSSLQVNELCVRGVLALRRRKSPETCAEGSQSMHFHAGEETRKDAWSQAAIADDDRKVAFTFRDREADRR